MRYVFLTAICMTAMILPVACKTTQSPSFDQIVYDAATMNDSVLKGADAAAKAHAISAGDFAAVLKVTDAVEAALTLADTAYKAGSAATANAKISAVAAAIAGVQACLAGPKTDLSQCLQGVTLP